MIKATGITFHIGGERAFYAPAEDYVQVPTAGRPSFEPINWHRAPRCMNSVMRRGILPSRLNRTTKAQFTRCGTKKYAFEELVAELSAAFGCASIGIVPTVRHTDYVGAWLEVLREDNRAIVRVPTARLSERRARLRRTFLCSRFIPGSMQMRRRIRLPGAITRIRLRDASAGGVSARPQLVAAARVRGGQGFRRRVGSQERVSWLPVVEIDRHDEGVQKITLSPLTDIPFNKRAPRAQFASSFRPPRC